MRRSRSKAITATFDEFRAGVETADGKRLTWLGNLRAGRIEVQEQQWTMNLDFTLDNYQNVISGKEFTVTVTGRRRRRPRRATTWATPS